MLTVNTLFPVVTFLKCVVTEVVLFLIVAFTDISQGSVVTHLVRSLVITLLQIFSWFWQWKNFENQLIFDKVKAFNKNCRFLATLYALALRLWTLPRLLRDTGHNNTSFGHSLKTFFSHSTSTYSAKGALAIMRYTHSSFVLWLKVRLTKKTAWRSN